MSSPSQLPISYDWQVPIPWQLLSGMSISLQILLHSCAKPFRPVAISCFNVCLAIFSSSFDNICLTKFRCLSLIRHPIGHIPTSQSRIACVTEGGTQNTLLRNFFYNLCNSLICFSVIPIHEAQLCNKGWITKASNSLNAMI